MSLRGGGICEDVSIYPHPTRSVPDSIGTFRLTNLLSSQCCCCCAGCCALEAICCCLGAEEVADNI